MSQDPDFTKSYDVVIIGGGNAALCAAISARHNGASVIVLEKATKFYRGGNTRHTRNMRCAHDTATETLTGPYTEDEYLHDLMQVTDGNTNEELARLMISESKDVLNWIQDQGVRFQPSLGGTLSLGRTNAFFLGGGRAMLNALYLTAERLGVAIAYDAEVTALEIENGMFLSAQISRGSDHHKVQGRSLIAAAGGFEANIEWLKEVWGPKAENVHVRGSANNQGTVLKMLMDAGAETVGDPAQAHAVAVDARSPKFDGGIITRLDCVIFGVVLNKHGVRFYDEGEDIWPKRYAIWGKMIADQPDQIAYCFFDAPCLEKFMPPLYPPIMGETIGELAEKLDLDPDVVEKTISDYNAAVQPGTFDHTILDDCRTEGLSPPKTHWAQKIVEPPFYAYPLRAGITFTYLATKVNRNALIQMQDGKPSANMYATGEMMSGNILGQGYAGGIGMTLGAVFGRIAGREAAKYARN